jgi:hypothetical protein
VKQRRSGGSSISSEGNRLTPNTTYLKRFECTKGINVKISDVLSIVVVVRKIIVVLGPIIGSKFEIFISCA